MRIEIHENAKNGSEMLDILNRVAELIAEGYTSGFGPDWELIDDEDIEREPEDEGEDDED